MSNAASTVLWLEPVTPSETASLRLEGDASFRIGRSRDADLTLNDRMTSREHATLTWFEGRWRLTDLGSLHGTFVNNRKLLLDAPAAVSTGDLIRFGPSAFRLLTRTEPKRRFTDTDAPVAETTTVTQLSPHELPPPEARRLDLLIDGVASVQACGNERELAEVAIRLALHGSGFGRATVLRAGDASERLEVVAWQDDTGPYAGPFPVSRTLVERARSGTVARLFGEIRDLSQSITELRIHSAICVPVEVEEKTVAYLYLDSREGESPGREDSVGYCAALARLCAQKLVDMKRERAERRLAELEQELRAARVVQETLTPNGVRETGGLRHASRILPGRYVAGDFFDIFEIPGGATAFCFGDVCGQGVAAGMLMSAVTAFTRASILRSGDVAAAAEEVNDYVCLHSERAKFVTIFLGLFRGREGGLHYIDAGHGHWLLRHAEAPPKPALPSGCPPLGWFAGRKFEARRIDLDERDRLILYSDGMVEHRNPEGEPFGVDRLAHAVSLAQSAQDDLEAAFSALGRFMQGGDHNDDTSLASLEVIG